VFAGRNWNAGETIGKSFAPVPHIAERDQLGGSSLAELVLRGADGLFLPASYLLSTLCHEVRFTRSWIGMVSYSPPVF